MNIVLLERVEHLGNLGDVVTVKPGYARNFLLPQAKALRATKGNMALFEQRKAALKTANDAKKAEAEKIAKNLDGQSFILIRQASEGGQLYGSVTNRDIAEILIEGKHNVVRNQVRLTQAIKNIGLSQVPVVLHPEVIVTVTVNIARSNEEAAIQTKTGKAFVTDYNAPEPKAVAEAALAEHMGEAESDEEAA